MAELNFKCKQTEKLWFDGYSKFLPSNIQETAKRKLRLLSAASDLSVLRKIPGNKLVGDRKGWYSIRINKQWRICFKWKASQAIEISIEDYH
jgi:toxin HigB-1